MYKIKFVRKTIAGGMRKPVRKCLQHELTFAPVCASRVHSTYTDYRVQRSLYVKVTIETKKLKTK